MDDHNLRNRFFLILAFLVGAIGIIVLKGGIFGISEPRDFGDSNFTAAIWAAAVLLIYWFVSSTFSDKNFHEIIGDNCYYLGFVFTLISLAVTLYRFDLPETTDATGTLRLHPVISGFGVALSSTIVGIMLRVLMQRMTPDIAQQEREARLDLDNAVRDFRAHLRMSVDELKRYSVETSQVLAEQRKAAQEAMSDGMNDYQQAFIRNATELEKQLSQQREALYRETAQQIQASRDAAQVAATGLRKALANTSQSIGEHYRVLQTGTAELSRQLAAALQAFAGYQEEAHLLLGATRDIHEQVADAAATGRSEIEIIRALIDSLGALSRDSRGLDAALAGLVSRLEQVSGGITRDLEPAIARLSQGTNDISATLALAAATLQTAAGQFEDAARRTAAADVQSAIAEALERLRVANNTLATVSRRLHDLADAGFHPPKRRWFWF